jgi:hypothetical protein
MEGNMDRSFDLNLLQELEHHEESCIYTRLKLAACFISKHGQGQYAAT